MVPSAESSTFLHSSTHFDHSIKRSLKKENWALKQILQENSGKMEEIEKFRKTLSSLKGHCSRHRARFDKNLQYSDIRRTEQQKIALLEQNDKVISHLEKMGEGDQSESLQTVFLKVWWMQCQLKKTPTKNLLCITKESKKI